MKYIVLLFLAGSFVLMIFGAAVPSFDFEFLGAAGWVLGQDNTFAFSLFSLGS